MKQGYVAVAGGRVGKLVPADDAGEYRIAVVYDDDLAKLLRPLRPTEEQLIAANTLHHIYCMAYGIGRRGSDMGAYCGGESSIEDVIDERAYMRYRAALNAVHPYKMIVARLIADTRYRYEEASMLLAGLDKLAKFFSSPKYDFS